MVVHGVTCSVYRSVDVVETVKINAPLYVGFLYIILISQRLRTIRFMNHYKTK